MTRPYIMVAANGARRGKTDHPALPVTLPEIVDTAVACHRAGANALHLHIRDTKGQHTLDAGRYRETLTELGRTVPQMRIQITTESGGRFDVPEQLACLEQVRPAWASVALREIARAPDLAQRLYQTCAEVGTEVQHILYDAQDAALLRAWQARGIVRPEQDSVLFVLGRYAAGHSSNPADLDPFLAARPIPRRWMVCAFGPGEHRCLRAAAHHGGALRVGFENSLTDESGQPWPDNAASVTALLTELETGSYLKAAS